MGSGFVVGLGVRLGGRGGGLSEVMEDNLLSSKLGSRDWSVLAAIGAYQRFGLG